jgi:putative two-component system response regulator
MLKRKTILAVDDIIPCLTMTKQILEPSYDVYLAKSIGSARIILKVVPVDLILLDIEMPGMSGFEFFDFIRDNPKYSVIPVIFVSSHATRDMFVRVMEAGAKDFLVKPVAPQVLLEKVNSFFDETVVEVDREHLVKGFMNLSRIYS